ncbi:MAG: MFS transporter, partial [Nevskiaceae bacterium]
MPSARSTARLPAGVWVLGSVSLLMDVSSEMIHGLLPVFLVAVIGATPLVLGLIEGVAEGLASLLKLVSGAWSDRLGRRKPLALAGYGLAAASKPFFPLADSVITVFAARMLDRVGKGIRGAPRDALIADLAPPDQRGAAFGLRQSLDTVGAVLGPLLAIALM